MIDDEINDHTVINAVSYVFPRCFIFPLTCREQAIGTFLASRAKISPISTVVPTTDLSFKILLFDHSKGFLGVSSRTSDEFLSIGA